jgi:hypothetical protein
MEQRRDEERDHRQHEQAGQLIRSRRTELLSGPADAAHDDR